MRKILLVFVQYVLDIDHETDTAVTGRYVTLPQAMQTVSNYVDAKCTAQFSGHKSQELIYVSPG